MERAKLVVTVVAALIVGPALLPSPVLAGSTDLLPDLQMAPVFGLELRTADSGHRHLRFGTIVYNVGDGPIEVRGRDRHDRVMDRIVQAIKRTDGTWRKVVKRDARLSYSGDGHDHWHIARFNRATLYALAGTPPSDERRLRKIGFCLVDSLTASDPPANTPPGPAYFGCGTRKSTRVDMGISVGWGDVYAPETRFQEIDVTGLPAGQYRLCTTTNPRGIWTEKSANFANNSTWVDIELDAAANNLNVIGTGATPC